MSAAAGAAAAVSVLLNHNQRRTIQAFAHQECEIPDPLTVLDDPKSNAPPDCCMFRVMSKDGDTRIVWNRFSVTEINAAKEMFDDLVAKGMVPYRVGSDGKATAEVMHEFDPNAQEVIFLPIRAISGG